MDRNNKVSVINVEEEASGQNNIESNLAAYEEKQKAIAEKREEYSIGMVMDSYERLSLTYLWRPAGGILFALLVILSGLVILPQHNVILEPGYWWECLAIQCNLVWINTSAMFFMSTANIFINLEGVYTYKHYLITWVVSVIFYSISWTLTYAIWTPFWSPLSHPLCRFCQCRLRPVFSSLCYMVLVSQSNNDRFNQEKSKVPYCYLLLCH